LDSGVAVGIVGAALGILGVAVSGTIYYLGGSRRRTVTVRLTGLRAPEERDLVDKLDEMTPSTSGRRLIGMKLTVKNRGPQDVQVTDFEFQEFEALRPRIRFPSEFRIVRIDRRNLYRRLPLDNPLPQMDSEVRLAIKPTPLQYQLEPGPLDVWIHVVRMSAKTRADVIFALMGPELLPYDSKGIPIGIGRKPIGFWTGWIQDVRVRPKGRYMRAFLRNARKEWTEPPVTTKERQS
jgi:hypothetical protein